MYYQISSKACGVVLKLWYLADNDNLFRKKELFDVCWMKDLRTFNKYWQELVDYGFIRQVKPKVWMVDPNEVFHKNADQGTLIARWERLVSEKGKIHEPSHAHA